MNYPFFEVQKFPEKKIAVVRLNRPEKRNAMNWPFWKDLPNVVNDLEKDKAIRSVVILGNGKSFSTGLDIEDFFTQFGDSLTGAIADKREELFQLILTLQEGFKRINASEKVYICGVHKHCIGGGLDLMVACDIRLATKDASISLRETRVAIVADMGSLNRLPQIIGMGNTRMLAFTGRDISGEEAHRMGLVSEIYDTFEELEKKSIDLATEIAANPSIAVRGTKAILNYMEDHGPKDGMDYVSVWNSAFLDSEDLREIANAFKEKRKPNFK